MADLKGYTAKSPKLVEAEATTEMGILQETCLQLESKLNRIDEMLESIALFDNDPAKNEADDGVEGTITRCHVVANLLLDRVQNLRVRIGRL